MKGMTVYESENKACARKTHLLPPVITKPHSVSGGGDMVVSRNLSPVVKAFPPSFMDDWTVTRAENFSSCERRTDKKDASQSSNSFVSLNGHLITMRCIFISKTAIWLFHTQGRVLTTSNR